MSRYTVLLLVLLAAGCSPASDRDDSDTTVESETEDGGTVDAQHDKAEAFLIAISESGSVEEERRRVVDFAAWLNEHNAKLQVKKKGDRVYTLRCPYFPPVTPWIDHTFYDPAHLVLLPQVKEGP